MFTIISAHAGIIIFTLRMKNGKTKNTPWHKINKLFRINGKSRNNTWVYH